MDDKKEKKEGVSVKEIQGFAHKHRLKVFFCLFFFLAGIFGLFLWSPYWSVATAAIGAIIGGLFPEKITDAARNSWLFVFRQDRTTQIIIAVIALVIAIFIPPLIFLLMGLHSGKSMAKSASDAESGT